MRVMRAIAADLRVSPRELVTALLALPLAIVVAAGAWFVFAVLAVSL